MASKVLIYGGSGGIGSATARLLRARGFDLHLAGRDPDKLAALATELGVSFTAGDVLDPATFPRVAQEAGAESGWITGQIFGVDGGRSTLRKG